MTTVLLALGGNLGDVASTFQRAIETLVQSGHFSMCAASPLYRTLPIGPDPQPPYLNAVIEGQTDLEPLALLRILKTTEAAFGREASAERWSARTLDIDILAFAELVVDLPELRIPHPRMEERGFVLEPLCALRPDWLHPVLHKRGEELLAAWRERVTGNDWVVKYQEGDRWTGISAHSL